MLDKFIFQSTLPRGERHDWFYLAAAIQNFNPRSREGSDIPRGNLHIGQMISIHAPARGATTAYRRAAGLLQDFNPRSREGSDLCCATLRKFTPISIHAPARGATLLRYLIPLNSKISIHAPARGATLLSEEDDRSPSISIHAPARGATRAGEGSESACSDFNPRSREGSDLRLSRFPSSRPGFQSTLPRGERRKHQERNRKRL